MIEVKQVSLFDNQENEPTTVECLGMTFNSEDERREYFRNELRKKLPELKEIEGYPIGEDEDIIALSDPPYYTACPNPWINEFVNKWEHEKNFPDKEVKSPLSVDVSEGKNDAIYNAHSYHTKVPYKAIMKYMLYYTNPGDIVFDGFCGSGMTGVAAEMCNNEEVVHELMGEKYQKSSLGSRKAIMMDLAPAATIIAHNYNKEVSNKRSEIDLNEKINKIKKEYRWATSTLIENYHPENHINLKEFYEKHTSNFGKINYIVWSEVYICSSCANEINYWDVAVSDDEKTVSELLVCPNCGMEEAKKNLEKSKINYFDNILNKNIIEPKRIPVKINYSVNNKRYNKSPDWYDLKVIDYFNNLIDYKNIPVVKFNNGVKTIEPIRNGMEYVHQVYNKRTLAILNAFLEDIEDSSIDDVQFLLGSTLPKLTQMNRYMPQHGSRALVGPMANALYFPPLSVENNVISQLEFQLKKIVKAWNSYFGNIISTQSSTKINIPDDSIDYIFIDPPFGANIMYSELSYIREAWLNIFTNNEKEAIENNAQGKSLNEYTKLMGDSFKEAFRILKPNHWITVEFSNTKASVWNALQYVIQSAGFVIASVDALDKKRGGFHAMITTTAVKQDLVISAYKPSDNNIIQMRNNNNSENSAWIFINQHLEKLPVFVGNHGESTIITERTPRILFDRMVAYHVQAGLSVPISSTVFQDKIYQKYVIRDGMVFLESQVAEYDKKRILAKDFAQQSLFVSDEGSAIEWLRQQLLKKPQSRQDLHPQFMKEIQHIAKHEELPELDNLLAENFLNYTDEGTVPDQIASYLRKNYHDMRGLDNDDEKLKAKAKNRWYVPDPSKQADLEKLREKSLLREFNHYIEEVVGTKKKLKVFRTEAIRAGFKKAWSERNYQEIVEVAERLPEKVIQEDDKLLMYYDNASIRLEI